MECRRYLVSCVVEQYKNEAAYNKTKTQTIASKVHVRRKEQMKFSIVAQESGERRRRAWGRGRGRVLMPMGGRRSAFEFLCLACIAYATLHVVSRVVLKGPVSNT